MSTAFKFTRRVEISDIPEPAKSVGAHLGAKLDLFGTDERTLTDELCDMMFIWLFLQPPRKPATSSLAFSLTLVKTTASREAANGADLELSISSPLGSKRCLIQAKVLDPATGKLRCDSKAGWSKLRKQLAAARKEVGELAFLLVYVPGSMLDDKQYGFSTFEQFHLDSAKGTRPAFYGATMIAVDDLLGKSNRWRSKKLKVPQIAPGHFRAGVAFWRVFLELLLCHRSVWTSQDRAMSYLGSPKPFRALAIGATEIDPNAWRDVQGTGAQWLRDDDEYGVDLE